MKLPSEAELLRIFIGEADKFEGKPLYEVIANLARKKGMAGATVIRGLMGFGAHSRMHTAKILRLSEDLPIIIEIVDEPEKIEALLPELDKMIIESSSILDRAEREKALQAINKRSVEEVAWIPLHYQQDIFAVVKGKDVKFTPRSDRWIVAKEIK